MKTHSKNPVFVSLVPFIFLLYSFAQFCYAATDTLRQGKTLRNGDTLISENSVFELGFFSPENSTFTYLGIWYKFNPKAVVWVANRDTPISHRNRVLRIEDDGKLVVREGNNSLVWSSNVTGSSNNAAAKLLDTGNFVLSRDDSIGDLNRALWQSFNEPTDTFLLEMRVLVNFKRGEYNAYRLLKSPDDPHPANECDHYNFCGNYSTCDQFDSRKCVCLEGFRPKSQDQWDARNWSGGCVRKIKLQCPSTDDGTSRGKGRFKKIRCTKLPDLANVFSPAGDLDACRRHCLENCSCTAYAFITGIQCMIWTGDLVDMQHFQHGGSLEFFYRLHHSELGKLWSTRSFPVAHFFKFDSSTRSLDNGHIRHLVQHILTPFLCHFACRSREEDFQSYYSYSFSGGGGLFGSNSMARMEIQDETKRPKMDAVVVFLEREAATLPMPTKPTYTSLRTTVEEEYVVDGQEMECSNDVTVTTIVGR
ncbi:hypothetical protein V6N12_062971 [Hibiscus sabdariffa]|uniref:non-specific serine/threonine protein kinase n=1 Tax=Hibiscus sabdariffa TaxID=183260 RepID=A0ABR2FAE2_9ROSI